MYFMHVEDFVFLLAKSWNLSTMSYLIGLLLWHHMNWLQCFVRKESNSAMHFALDVF